MSTFKRILSYAVVLLLGVGVFYLISTKSKKNPGFDDKSKWEGHNDKLIVLEQKMKSLSTEIKANMGNGKCEYDYECRVAGLGVKTCGGYKNFIVYSIKDTEESELLSLIGQFNQASEDFNEFSINVPGCGEQAKQPYCLTNRCTIKGQ
jgi:hypothetical protein